MKNTLTRIALTACGILTLASTSTQAVVTLAGPIINPANGHSYYLLPSTNWTTSESQAVALGGHLVTINDVAENNWVSNTFLNLVIPDGTRDLWLGLNDAAVEGTFVWSSGEAVTYSNWEPGNPNNGGGNVQEDYVHMYGGGTPPHIAGWVGGAWNDIDNKSSYSTLDGSTPVTRNIYGVVETVPEPSAVALLGICIGLTIKRRLR